MKSILKKLFSPSILIVLILLLEVVAVIAIPYFIDVYLDSSYELWGILVDLGWRILLSVIEIILFFKIIRKHENPEYKIPWITGMIIFPISSIICFLIFANHGLRRKDRKIVEPTRNLLEEGFHVEEEEGKEFFKDVPAHYISVFKYLNTVDHLLASDKNKVTYYKVGEEFFPEFVKSLKKAENFIMMEFFIVTDGFWWKQIEDVLIERAEHGVEVMLIYDDLGSFGGLPFSYPKTLGKHGIKCYKFHPFRPILSGIYNNRDHRKIAVIDHRIAFTGGMNLADEYANKIEKYGYWKDTMVKVEGHGISNFIATFLQNYDLCTGKISDYRKYLEGDYPSYDEPGYIHFFGDGPGGYDGNEPIGEENYLQIINSATETLWISTPYLIPTFRLSEGLKSAAKRGVDVKLFVPGIPDKKLVWWMAKNDFKNLTDAGVKIYLYAPGFNHEKQMVADEKLAFCGTINFDFRSLTHHFECGVTLYDVPCIKNMAEDFKEMEKVSEPASPENSKVSGFQRFFVGIARIFRALL